MFLDATNKTLKVKLGEAISTTECDIAASWEDVTTSAFLIGANDTTTNGATAVTAVAAPASSHQRRVKMVSVYNADAIDHTVIVEIVSGANTRLVVSVSVAVGESLVYANGEWSIPGRTSGGGGTAVSDTAFGSSWNAVTDTAPSKNAVYDALHAFDTDDDGKVNVLDMGAGIVKTDAGGVVSAATEGSDYLGSGRIDDTAYNATTWNGDTTHAPSKNAVRDKIESMPAGDVVGPGSATDSDFAQFDSTTGKLIKDGGLARDIDGTLAANSDTKIPSQKAVKTYVDANLGSAGVSDTAFASSWNGVTGIAPSKNAVYDQIHLFDTADDGTIIDAGTGYRIAGAAASNKILKGNGTNFVASTETYAAPGASGNVLTSDGTNWTSAAPSSGGTTSKVSGSNFTTTNLTATDITGLTFAASANTVYEVDVMIKTQSSTAAGNKFALNFSAAGATGQFILIATALSNANNVGHYSQSIGTLAGLAVDQDGNTDHTVFIKAIITIGANAGNITVQTAKVTSGTATVYIGSRMTVTAL